MDGFPETGALMRLAPPRQLSAAEFCVLMDEAGVLPTELATRLGSHPSAVANWRLGDRPVPGYVVAYLDLVKAAKRAGVAFEAGRGRGRPRKIAA